MTGDAEYWTTAYRHKVIEPEKVEAVIAQLRRQGKTIATLNGSFDLMHAGHLHMIYEASKQADVLVVALNTDLSIQQYKSPLRPIVPLEYRLQMMAALGFVDYVSYFDELDPRAFLEKVKPDVHVNGAEYGENCIEADVIKKHGGRLKIVELIPGLSTSQILTKVKQLG
jgi:rfaE bifunctional protein nucleotidyltransferase chain/domain